MPNYAIKPTPELAIRSSRAFLPARLIAALDFMFSYIARCVRGQGTLFDAVFGIMFLGSLMVGAFLLVVLNIAQGLGGFATVGQAVVVVYSLFLLFACVCIWRCAFNFRYWAVSVAVRAMAFIYGIALAMYIYHITQNAAPTMIW